jgi:ChrR Cupin-like domain
MQAASISMSKPQFEFFDVSGIEWTQVDDRLPGLSEQILAHDDQTGAATRLLKFEPGTNTSVAGVQMHPFWEEVFILEGSLHDLTLDDTFRKGSYACRPPGMRHGPWEAPEGCLTFEVRYYLDS